MRNERSTAELDSSVAWAESAAEVSDTRRQWAEVAITRPEDSDDPNGDMDSDDAHESTSQESEVAIVIMGLTGSGKSSFISLLTDEPVQIGHTLESCTENVNFYSFKLDAFRTVHVIDTPGFDDTTRSDAEVLKQIAFSLNAIYRQKITLAGVLYLHRITDPRVSGSSLKNLNVFKKLCGIQASPYTVLATTMWSALEQAGADATTGAGRERKLAEKDDFWGTMTKNGSRVMRHSGDAESARRIISYLVDKQASVVLDIQRQMVDESLTLDETSAGQFVQKELLEARKRHEKELLELQESMREALREKDHDLVSELSNQEKERLAMISQTNTDQAKLKVTFVQLMQEESKRYADLAQKLEMERAQREADTKAREKELQELEQHMASLQDDLDRTKADHRREVNRVLKEQRGKSVAESRRFENMIYQQNVEFEKQSRYMTEMLAQERAARSKMKRELKDRQNRPNFLGRFLGGLFATPDDNYENVHVLRRSDSMPYSGSYY